jgi:hypothetical protein
MHKRWRLGGLSDNSHLEKRLAEDDLRKSRVQGLIQEVRFLLQIPRENITACVGDTAVYAKRVPRSGVAL